MIKSIIQYPYKVFREVKEPTASTNSGATTPVYFLLFLINKII